MSLFGALMGDFEDGNSLMRGHMRRMNTMMNSLFGDPFGDMMGRSIGGSEMVPFGGVREHRGREVAQFNDFGGMGFPMMGMGFPNMQSMFMDMGRNPNCHSFSSSTVMTMTAGPDGRPQVYQASQSVKQGPGGVRETKKTVADTRTGVKKMAIGHHIQDRAHIIEREQNVYSGEQEERQDFINLEEEEAEQFNKEWEAKARHMMRNNANAIDYGRHSRRRPSREPQLALPSTQPQSSSRLSSRDNSRRLPSSYPALSASTPYTPSSSSREEGRRSDDRLKKRKIESGVVIEEVEDSTDEEEDTPQRKHMKVESNPIVRSPTPSSASSDEEQDPEENDEERSDHD